MLKVLVGGWLAGGLIIVAMSVNPRAEGAPPHPAVRVAHVHPLPAERGEGIELRVPVLGVDRSDLKDTFEQVRGGGRRHGAIDILAPRGTPVIAVVDGTIRKLFNSRAGGLTIYQFDNDEKRIYYYAHLDRYADGIREGMRVKAGDVIGYVGTTGNAPPDTPHLHFSIEDLPPTKEWWKGVAVNPYPLLTRPVSALR